MFWARSLAFSSSKSLLLCERLVYFFTAVPFSQKKDWTLRTPSMILYFCTMLLLIMSNAQAVSRRAKTRNFPMEL